MSESTMGMDHVAKLQICDVSSHVRLPVARYCIQGDGDPLLSLVVPAIILATGVGRHCVTLCKWRELRHSEF